MELSGLKKDKRVKAVLELNEHLFTYLLVSYLLLLLIEQIWPMSVAPYLNLNNILVFVIVSGAVLALTGEEKRKKEKSILDNKKVQIGVSILAGILGFAIIYYKLSGYGFGLWISAIAGVLIVLLSMLVFEEE